MSLAINDESVIGNITLELKVVGSSLKRVDD